MRHWLPTIAWMMLIFVVSSRPALQAASINWLDFGLKKTAHFVEYFILATLMARSFKRSTTLGLSAILTLSLMLTVLYAASDEYHQTFVVSRGGRSRDVLIDSTGALAACLVLRRKHPINTTG